MTEVTLGLAFLRNGEAKILCNVANRLGSADQRVVIGDTEAAVIAFAPASAGSGALAIGYALAPMAASVGEALSAGLSLTADEAEIVNRITPAEILFHWEDDALPASSRGAATPVMAAISIDADAADGMRQLVGKMLAHSKECLIERARHVGYYREAMALASDGRGGHVYLLYLELVEAQYATVVRKLIDYPETPFTRWWTPPFMAHVGRHLIGAATSEVALRLRTGSS